MVEPKPGIQVIEKQGLYYVVEDGNHVRRFKPWLGDMFSFLYDFVMRRSVFPKKFEGDIQEHYHILRQMLADVHEQHVLELGTGSGSAVNFLEHDNRYTGTDISPGLLKQAVKRFEEAGFPAPEFYVMRAGELFFSQETFDLCLCILSLNFFDDVRGVLAEVKRVLVPGGIFVCSVPVPERNENQSTIHGTLYSEAALEEICRAQGFRFEVFPEKNGALLYFRASRPM